MSDRLAFLQAICENPDDDTHRLVFADWLEENAGPEERDWAGFIRAQCHLARYCSPVAQMDLGVEAGLLLPAQRRKFLKPFTDLNLVEVASRYHDGPGMGCSFVFRRGFVEEVGVYGRLGVRRVVEVAERLFALTPLQHLRFHFAPLYSFRSSLREHLDGPRLADFVPLLRLPAVARLRTLDLSGHGLGDALAGLLMGGPHLTARTQLLLGGNQIGRDLQDALRDRFGDSVNFEARPRAFLAPGDNEDDIPF